MDCYGIYCQKYWDMGLSKKHMGKYHFLVRFDGVFRRICQGGICSQQYDVWTCLKMWYFPLSMVKENQSMDLGYIEFSDKPKISGVFEYGIWCAKDWLISRSNAKGHPTNAFCPYTLFIGCGLRWRDTRQEHRYIQVLCTFHKMWWFQVSFSPKCGKKSPTPQGAYKMWGSLPFSVAVPESISIRTGYLTDVGTLLGWCVRDGVMGEKFLKAFLKFHGNSGVEIHYPPVLKHCNVKSTIDRHLNGKIFHNWDLSIATFDCQRVLRNDDDS